MAPVRAAASLPDERLRLWNETSTDYPRQRTVHVLFEEQAARSPAAVAISFEGAQVSYRELDRRANRLARYLMRHGAGPEVPVGICVERSVELVIGILAISKAGGAYLPLDPDYPEQRLAFMLEDTRAPIVLTQESLRQWLPNHGGRTICLDAEWPAIAAESAETPRAGAAAGNLAYIIYTSGSTGKPKGSTIIHRSVVRLVRETNYARLSPDETFLQLAPVSFDASTFELWASLLNGARLVVYPPHQLSLEELGRTLESRRVTTLWLTSALFQQMVDSQLGRLRYLRQFLAGGETLPVPHVERMIATLTGNQRLINGYGPTENTTFTCCHPMTSASRFQGSVPIGRPIANTRVYLLDPRLLPVAVGEVGELWTAGDGLARGYLNAPRLTASRFIPDPFADRPGERLYRVGDQARYLPAGSIEFLGRTDDQIKIRGFRVELGEIEARLLEHPRVREGVVILREDRPGDRRLVAYLIAEDREPEAVELREFLGSSLPDYMIPSQFVFLEALPLTANLKVDRRALPVPRRARALVAPRTPLERELAGLWQQVLNLEPGDVGAEDGFVELGGDSIRGALLVNQLHERLGEAVYISALFDAPTVAELADYLVRNYDQAAAKICGESGAETAPLRQEPRIVPSQVAHLRQLIEPLEPRTEPSEPKNPPAVFVLSPPRSGSTLFRIMLGGHPGLFAPPELELLSFNTLEQRREVCRGRYGYMREGTIRALMEIERCSPEEAERLMAEHESRRLSAQRFYGLLQEWVAPRILVDKSTTYSQDLEVLRRGETDFEGALYIHLVRHPCAVIHSFREARIDRILRFEHSFSARQLAELSWLTSHENILAFLREVPPERHHRVAFEELLGQPEKVLSGVSRFLGLELHPDMLDPYRHRERRMTDGLYAESRVVGDYKFQQHRRLDPSVAYRWRGHVAPESVGDATRRLAGSLGYDQLPAATRTVAAIPRAAEAETYPLSFAQQRLWFLDQLGAGAAYHSVRGYRLAGELDVPALGAGLSGLVRRHEILRTSFVESSDGPRQVIRPAFDLPLPVVDLSALGGADREAEARRQAAESVRLRFDLARDPLLRAVLFELSPVEHALVLNLHHIVFDGWSAGVLHRELAALYAAFARGDASSLPPLAIQYADFAVWQRRWLSGSVRQEQLDYWKTQLADLSPLELMADRPRPAEQTYAAKRELLDLPRRLAEAIQAFGVDETVTPFMTLLAAFAVLLGRYTGQVDVAVGSPIANRSRAEIEPLIGFFVNSLVMRTDLSGNPTFRQLASRVRRGALAAFAHQDIPFEQLVEELQPERDLSRSPLFQVLFAVQNADSGTLELPGVAVSRFDPDVGTTHFDLELHIRESGDGLAAELVYNTDLFDPATVEGMAGHYHRLIEAAVAQPDRDIDLLPMLGAAERRLLLFTWNDTAAALPEGVCLQQLFEAQAARTPERVAVVDGRRDVRYDELDAWAGALAARLRELGVRAEVPVGIHLARGVDMVVAILATLKAGGTYLPLDPGYPRERIRYMLEDARAAVVVSSRLGADDLKGLGGARGPTVVLAGSPPPADPATAAAPSGVEPSQVAYLIYTSGSTGRPKGVAITHANAVALVAWARTAHDDDDLSGVLAATSMCFDLSIFEIFVPLAYGGTMILAENALALPSLPARDRVRLINTVPSAMTELVRSGAVPSSVRTVNLAGEPLPPALVDQIYDLGVERVFDLYGPSETTTYTSGALRRRGGPATIGRPLANERIYLLDGRSEPVPAGVAGELHVGGRGVARGYARAPALTAAKFVPDPFAGGVGERLYRTGDLARHRAGGDIEFLGRLDFQVKVRGFRIELGEIESALEADPRVRQAVVSAPAAGPDAGELVAYLVAEDDDELSVRGLRRRLAQTLPDYMVPSSFAILDEMPLNANGKVDRGALGRLKSERPAATAGGDVAPRSAVEERLAAIWRQVLRLERVGVFDDFFELGGHSLMVTQVVSRVRDALAVELPFQEMFRRPTVAALAEAVCELQDDLSQRGAPPLVVGRRGPAGDGWPLSFAQQRLWFLDQLGAGAAYNMPRALRLSGPLDSAALAASLSRIASRHEALRTRFASVSGEPRQVVDPARQLSLPVVDLSALDAGERQAEARRWAAEEFQRPFDLARGSLLRSRLLRWHAGEHVLLLTMHHIVSDGWSLGILQRELGACYRAFVAGRAPRLPALPVQYADFACWQRRWLQGEVLEAQLDYWRRQFDEDAGGRDLPVLELPTDRPRPAVQTFVGGQRWLRVPEELCAGMTRLAQGHGATLAMTLLAAFKTLLARYTQQTDVAVGSPIAGRNRSETEGLVGFFVNSLVLRTDLGGDPTFGDLLLREREVALGAYEHQDLPFERLVEELDPERDLAQNPLFQVVFGMQNSPQEELVLPGLEARRFESGRITTRFDLEAYLWQEPPGLRARFVYNRNLFDASSIARMVEHFRHLLASAAADPEARISRLPMLSRAQRHQLAGEWNDTARAGRRAPPVAELFEQQAARSADAVAVSFGDRQLSYGELRTRSRRLARMLRSHGVGPGVRVVLCVDSGPEMIIGMLAVITAGGAYVPLAPDTPTSRLAFMIEDCRAAVVLARDGSPAGPLPAGVGRLDLDVCCRLADFPGDDLPLPAVASGHPAYLIYTSGSTGRPKAVAIDHRGLSNLVAWHRRAYAVLSEDRATQIAAMSFDACVWEVWPYLASGASVHVAGAEARLSPRSLWSWLAEQRITLTFVPTPLAEAALTEPLPAGLALRALMTGGDRLRRAPGRRLPFALINHYGPTESTVVATAGAVGGTTPPTIGRPIGGVRARALGRRLEPAAPGVAGELYLAGDSLAWGYYRRPGLTAGAFLPDPESGVPGLRQYRTGDLVRIRPDGEIDFLGRTDHQVKIRGFRIELGEIEATLCEHRRVRDAVVAVNEDQAGNRRLVGYVVAEDETSLDAGEAATAAIQEEQVEHWHSLYEQAYGGQETGDPTFHIAGWNSSYTGEAIPAAEMRQWVDQSVERILARDPRRVLEIGCGTGLLLFRVAPRCRSYRATDFSQPALDHVARHRRQYLPPATELLLERRLADDFSGIAPGSFDTVILSSIIQYFPGVDYLLRVLEGAVEAVAPGGTIFVGDVRNLKLLAAYHASVQLHRAPDGLPPSELRQRVEQQLSQEEELLVDPAFFLALRYRLPRIRRVRIEPRRGREHNELTRFRYDVTLDVEPREEAGAGPAEISWSEWRQDESSLEAVRARLEPPGGQLFGIRGVPNARTLAAAWLARLLGGQADGTGSEAATLSELRQEVERRAGGAGVDPEDVWRLADGTPYEARLSWSTAREDGAFDVLFASPEAPASDWAADALSPSPPPRSRPWSSYVNSPLQARVGSELVPRLEAHLRARMPEYMVPGAFVALDRLPLTPHGKVDRGRLPSPSWQRSHAESDYLAPRTATEERVAEIWRQLLRLDQVGAHDNFFRLGGHSLLAARLVMRVGEAFGVEVELHQIFEQPSLAALAERVDALQWAITGSETAAERSQAAAERSQTAAVPDGEREGGLL